MDTKLRADIAESAATTELLKRGFRVLKPYGDRLPYDLALDVDGKLIRIQVKCAWFSRSGGCYVVDARRTKTNRRRMLRGFYTSQDFDFAILAICRLNVFYIVPVDVFRSFGSTISLVEADKRQRKPKSAEYRERWELLSPRARPVETPVGILPNSVKPEMVIPSQARGNITREGVETRR